MRYGSRRLKILHQNAVRLTNMTIGSCICVLAYWFGSARHGVKSQPMCEWKKLRRGLWGSSSVSEWTWCLLWTAAQLIAPPWSAQVPKTRSRSLTTGCASKLRWVSIR
jgi:hypothetical protein